MSFLNRSWNIQDIMNAETQRAEKASYSTIEFLGKQYELKPESLSDKLRNSLRRSQVNTYYVIFKFKVTSDTGHTHKVYIRTLPKADLNGPVQIFCDCNDFKYRCAYTLQNHNALFRSTKTDVQLGEANTTATKRQSKTIHCKHAFAALQELTNNFNSYLG